MKKNRERRGGRKKTRNHFGTTEVASDRMSLKDILITYAHHLKIYYQYYIVMHVSIFKKK